MRLDRSSARRALFAVPLWACAAVPAFAAQQEVTIVLGAGQKTCGEYLAVVYGLVPGRFRIETTPTGKTYGNDARALYEWLAGYISAANATSPDGVQIKTNPAAIDVWMRKHAKPNRQHFPRGTPVRARTKGQMTAKRKKARGNQASLLYQKFYPAVGCSVPCDRGNAMS
jgi:hypothetical protein